MVDSFGWPINDSKYTPVTFGNVSVVPSAFSHKSTKPCSVDGCDRQREARGYCHGHYERFRSGRPVGGPFADTPLKRFMRHVEPDGDCWIWQGATDGDGRYGAMQDAEGKRVLRAHRWALLHLADIDVPEGMVVDHLCRRTLCVNPDHLEIVTQRDNILRGGWGGGANARKSHCKRGHRLEGANVAPWSKPGTRQCWPCDRLRKRAVALGVHIDQLGETAKEGAA